MNQSLLTSLPPSPVDNSKPAPRSPMAHHSHPNRPDDSILNVNASGINGRALTRIQRRKTNMRCRQRQQQFQMCHRARLPQQVAPPCLNLNPRKASQNRNVSVSLRGRANTSALTAAGHVQNRVSFRNTFAPTQGKDPIPAPPAASLLRPRVTCTNTANRTPTG